MLAGSLAAICINAAPTSSGSWGLSPARPGLAVFRVDLPENDQVRIALPFTPADAAIPAIFAAQLDPGTDAASADRVLKWVPETEQYLTLYRRAADGAWIADAGTVDPNTITLAAGEIFYLANPGPAQTLLLAIPVALTQPSWPETPNPVDTNASVVAPCFITAVAVAAGGGITLFIDTGAGGAAVGPLDILARNLSTDATLANNALWSLVAEALEAPVPANTVSSTTDLPFTWIDTSFPVTPTATEPTTFTRVYHVAAQALDTDGDGVSDAREVLLHGSNPISTDSDADGLPDNWEIANALDPLTDDAQDDPDGDGLTNIEEYELGTDPVALPLPPTLRFTNPRRTIQVNYAEMTLTAHFKGGTDQASIQRYRTRFPGREPPQYAMVESIDAVWDGETIQTWPNSERKLTGTAAFTLHLVARPEGEHTLEFVAQWARKSVFVPYGLGKSGTLTVDIDRTPPAALDPATVTIVGGSLDRAANTIHIDGREFAFSAPVAADVVWVAFQVAPKINAMIAYDALLLADGRLNVTIKGTHMGKTKLTVQLLDQARNCATTEFIIERIAPLGKGGDAQ